MGIRLTTTAVKIAFKNVLGKLSSSEMVPFSGSLNSVENRRVLCNSHIHSHDSSLLYSSLKVPLTVQGLMGGFTWAKVVLCLSCSPAMFLRVITPSGEISVTSYGSNQFFSSCPPFRPSFFFVCPQDLVANFNGEYFHILPFPLFKGLSLNVLGNFYVLVDLGKGVKKREKITPYITHLHRKNTQKSTTTGGSNLSLDAIKFS